MSSTRREFLKSAVGGSTVISLAPVLPSLLAQAAARASEPGTDGAGSDGDTILVVVQLSGGNDGLNTVVPYDDDTYGRNRSTLRLTAAEVHKIESSLGFHPRMQAYWQLYQEGVASVIQGVGYPKNDRSHDVALREWHTARPGDATCQTGWLGRAIDSVVEPNSPVARGVFVGAIATPFALNAERSVVPSIAAAEQCIVRETGATGRDSASTQRASTAGSQVSDNSLVEHVRRSSVTAHAGSQRIRQVLGSVADGADYPSLQLAGSLKTVAQLIRAELGARIFFTELGGGGIGGFDNHAGQRDNHAALLSQFSESVTAFARDLQHDGTLNRVLLMTFSEFGRTLSENGRRGTGHGAAAPCLLVGGKLRGGLIGQHPSLTDLDNDAPKFHTDYRRVYATALEKWLGFDSRFVLGRDYEPLDIFA